MDYPRHLISHVARTGDIATPKNAGIAASWIADPESGRVWRYVIEYHTQYGKPPSVDVLAAEYPTYVLLDEPEPVEYIVDKLRNMRAMAMLEAALDQAVGALERGDVQGVQDELSAVLADLAVELPSAHDVDITQTGAQRMERYREVAQRDGALVGVTSGFEALDRATGGFRKRQLIVLAGPPKAGKSTAAIFMAMAAHVAYKIPFFLGFEMSNEEQEERIDSLRAQVAANDLRDGRLSHLDMKRVELATRRMEAMVPFWLSADTSRTSTVSAVLAKIQQLKPHLAVIDGVYMMRDESGEKPGSPQAMTNISRSFKRAAQAADIPIVITTQMLLSKMRDGKATMDSIGYSSAFAQDADVIIAIVPTREHDIFRVQIVDGRNVAPCGFYVRRDWKGGQITELAYDPFGEEDFDEDDLDDDRF